MTYDKLRSVARRAGLAGGLAVACALATGLWCAVADDPPTLVGTKADPARAALHLAVEKNLSYCRDWLAAKDWKSLRQTADGVGILTAVLGQHGDEDAWRKGIGRLTENVEALCTAADDKAADKCKQLIEQLAASNKALAKLSPKGKSRGDKPLESLRPLMALLDATHADAKAAVAVGDLAEAKSMAVVLSELGRVVSNHRADAAWRAAADALIRSAAEAADGRQSDAKAVRQKLRGVYEKCEACHERLR